MEEIKATYNPKEIIEYLERKGSLTPKDLERDWKYNRLVAISILNDLERLGVIVPEEMDVDGRKVYIRNYRLTEAGRRMKDLLRPRTIILTTFPMISQVLLEQTNYLIKVLQAKRIGPDELKEMLESNSPELKELIKESHLSILKDLSPDELRQLAREIEEGKRRY